MHDAIKKETEAERDRLKALIAKATTIRNAAGQADYIVVLEGALAKVEEALEIMNNANRT